jgi:lipopolysaccharide export LptBFGC system permease protein LptF
MMIKTLHWYFLRELGRIFVLTTGVLTTILAFGGTFKPLTKQGLTLVQLMRVLTYLMPAMLAYSIPLAALFAAVMVYWRLSTDNEITGARASGISFQFLLVPALVLGLAVAAIDLAFVDFVVPAFLQKSSHAIQSDVASVLLDHLDKHEPFQVGDMVVYANQAYRIPVPKQLQPPQGIRRTILQLRGLAATTLTNGKPTAVVLAKGANVLIDKVRARNQVEVAVQLDDGTAFDPNSVRQLHGTVRYLPADGKPYVIGSLLQNVPKFFSITKLNRLYQNPYQFRPIAALKSNLDRLQRFAAVGNNYLRQYSPAKALRFNRLNRAAGHIVVYAPAAFVNPDDVFCLAAHGNKTIRLWVYRHHKVTVIYTADFAALTLHGSWNAQQSIRGSLTLSGNVRMNNPSIGKGFHAGPATIVLGDLAIPHQFATLPPTPRIGLAPLTAAESPTIVNLKAQIARHISRLDHVIESEVQSRRSFAFSCLVLVMLGAALGILLQGHNPLAVFVVGFFPAMILILLITTGRTMVVRATGSAMPGLWVIWMGNGIIVLLNLIVYSRLLRK